MFVSLLDYENNLNTREECRDPLAFKILARFEDETIRSGRQGFFWHRQITYTPSPIRLGSFQFIPALTCLPVKHNKYACCWLPCCCIQNMRAELGCRNGFPL